MNDDIMYSQKQEESMQRFEKVCKRCGACCGSEDGDPCRNLVKQENGQFFCKTYENRLGPQETLSGNIFNCVVIREMIKRQVLRKDCAYNVRVEGINAHT